MINKGAKGHSIFDIDKIGKTDPFINIKQNGIFSLFEKMQSWFFVFSTTDNGNSFSISYPDLKTTESNNEPGLKNLSRLFPNNEIPEETNRIISKVYNSGNDEHHFIHLDEERQSGGDFHFSKIHDDEVVGIYRDLSGLSGILNNYEQNRRNLVKLQDNVPIGLFQADNEGKFDFVNKWFVKILGYPNFNELKKKKLDDLFVDKEKFSNLYKSLLQKGRLKETEIQLHHYSKGTIWAVISIQCVYDEDENLENTDGFVYDITERKTALDQLKENEAMFKAISQNLTSALYMFGQQGEFIYCNPATSEITGYTKEEILNMKFYDLIHRDFSAMVKERGLKRLGGKRVPKRYEFKIITKNKLEKWLEVQATQLMIGGERVVLGLANDITERKQFVDTLKTSEEKYRSLYSFFRLMADNVPDLIWAKNLKHEYIFVNKAMSDRILMANDLNEPIGKTQEYFAERVRATNPDKSDWYTFGSLCPNSDEIVLKNEKYQTFNEFGTVNGEYIYLDVHKAPLVDDDGRIIGTVGSARDVTEQKQLEEEREREENIKHFVYKISNAINTTKDLNELLTVIRIELSQVIDTKNLYIALYNQEAEELSLPYFVDEKDRFTGIPAQKTLTHYLIKKNEPLLLRESDIIILADQNKIDITGTIAKVWLGVPLQINNETIGALVVQNYKDETAFNERDLELIQFVSAQISVSINQKQADDALRGSEFALRQIIDNIPVMIFAKDRKLRFVLANQAFASAYDKRVGGIEGKLQSEIHPVPEEVQKYNEDDELLLSGKTDRIETEENFTRSDNDVRIIKTVKVPLKSVTDKGIAILGVAIDITESKNFEIELKSARDKAEESDRLKTSFLANMSHEIRTPMNAIIGFSELLNDPDLTNESRKEFVTLISDNSKVLLNLIEDIIDVAKIEARQVKVVQSSCQVNAILNELKSYYLKQLKKYDHKNIEIKVNNSVDDESFAIISDPLRFKQIMNNLIGNALKFTESGFIEFGYELDEPDNITFYVKDTGIGLARDKMSLIFERFRQGEESSTKEYGGAGLGLTISKRLVEMLGGDLWVESVLNEGSTFYFNLPLRITSIDIKTKQFTPQSGKMDWSDKTILVAEDEMSNFELIKATLHRTNVNIIRAVNGREAVEICKAKGNRIDLILMDIRMPEMNGYEATRIIKSSNKDLPVISLTAYAMSDDKEKSFHAGCNEYVSKPFNPVDLLEKIGRFI